MRPSNADVKLENNRIRKRGIGSLVSFIVGFCCGFWNQDAAADNDANLHVMWVVGPIILGDLGKLVDSNLIVKRNLGIISLQYRVYSTISNITWRLSDSSESDTFGSTYNYSNLVH